jgi:hypothetical protein
VRWICIGHVLVKFKDRSVRMHVSGFDVGKFGAADEELEGTVVVLAASRHLEFFESILYASDPFCSSVDVIGA